MNKEINVMLQSAATGEIINPDIDIEQIVSKEDYKKVMVQTGQTYLNRILEVVEESLEEGVEINEDCEEFMEAMETVPQEHMTKGNLFANLSAVNKDDEHDPLELLDICEEVYRDDEEVQQLEEKVDQLVENVLTELFEGNVKDMEKVNEFRKNVNDFEA